MFLLWQGKHRSKIKKRKHRAGDKGNNNGNRDAKRKSCICTPATDVEGSNITFHNGCKCAASVQFLKDANDYKDRHAWKYDDSFERYMGRKAKWVGKGLRGDELKQDSASVAILNQHVTTKIQLLKGYLPAEMTCNP